MNVNMQANYRTVLDLDKELATACAGLADARRAINRSIDDVAEVFDRELADSIVTYRDRIADAFECFKALRAAIAKE